MNREQLMTKTKAQLVDMLIEQQHLASAVEAKDNEINRIKEQAQKDLLALENEYKDKLEIRVNAKTAEIKNLTTTQSDVLAELNKKNEANINQLKQKYEADINQLKADNKRLEEVVESLANNYSDTIERYHSLLKINQGATDSHIELLDLSRSKLMAHFPNAKKAVK